MSHDHDRDARAARDAELYPVRVHERQPNFILMAVMAFAVFLIITSYFGR